MPFFRVRLLRSIGYALPLFAAIGCGGGKKPAVAPSAGEEKIGAGDSHSGPAAVGQPAPDLSLQTVNGKGRIGIEGLSGKVVLIDFWATWCGPCRKSFPALQELSRRHAGRVEVVGVSVNDESDGVADFAKELGTTFAIGWDEGHTIAERWKVTTMPSSFVVDGTGTVRFVHNGYHEGDEAELEKEVASLLGKSGASDKPAAGDPRGAEKPNDVPVAALGNAAPAPTAAAKPRPKIKKRKKKPTAAAH